jgi:hypothetical protein
VSKRRILEAALADAGFVTPVRFTAEALLLPLNPEGGLVERPLLPRAHDGRQEDLSMLRYDTDGERRWVARFWDSGFRTTEGMPIWLSQLGRQRLTRPVFLFSLIEEKEAAANALLEVLPPGFETRVPPNADPPRLLIRPVEKMSR